MFDLRTALIRLLALLPALTLHEFAHAYSAMRAGDPTPAMHGRVTLNPLAHLDPIGTLAILFLPIGWAKPVPINPMNFRNPRRDAILTSALGPLSNVAQAIFWGLLLRALVIFMPGVVGSSQDNATLLGGFIAFMILINVALAIFNLLPIGPLDGHHIMENALPYPYARQYTEFNTRYGMFVLFGFLILASMSGIMNYIILLPAFQVGRYVSGVNIFRMISSAGLF